MSNEVFEPMRKSGIVLLVVLCFAAGIASLVEKQWSQGGYVVVIGKPLISS